MKKTRILIADDHALLRVGLNTMLNTEADMTVVGEAGNGRDAVARAKELKPDVVIMDLMMPKLDGAEATRQIVEAVPGTKIIILTSYGSSSDLLRAINNGATGAQMKGSPIGDLLAAIRSVAVGKTAIDPEIGKFAETTASAPVLTKRQHEVLLGVSNGLTSEQIADDLGISVSAVKQHITAACEKLGASSRAEAAAIALKRNLLET